LYKIYGILEPVLGGTAGRRNIRCGGLQLFRAALFPVSSLPLPDEFRIISRAFPSSGIRVTAHHWPISAAAVRKGIPVFD
jgi:hypothetical protein